MEASHMFYSPHTFSNQSNQATNISVMYSVGLVGRWYTPSVKSDINSVVHCVKHRRRGLTFNNCNTKSLPWDNLIKNMKLGGPS